MGRKIAITGGAGFIGSHVVRLFVQKFPNDLIFNVDSLTYAGNLENLKDVENAPNYRFLKVDITDEDAVDQAFKEHEFSHVIHLAAESHVDRSITDPLAFLRTNIFGTVNLMNAAKALWAKEDGHLFYHVSTDEVYGSLGDTGLFLETTSYDPQSPYSASKASSDHFVRAYANTYNFPIVISNCSNNYGPNQFPEKLIPLCIHRIKHNQEIPVYGKGENIRDWLYVVDHAIAIEAIFSNGRKGETYNIGGNNEWTNLALVHSLCDRMDIALNRPEGSSRKLITFVKDRAGHDMRYAIDSSKLMKELNWEPSVQVEEGMAKTIDWYLANEDWLDSVTSGKYQDYVHDQYAKR